MLFVHGISIFWERIVEMHYEMRRENFIEVFIEEESMYIYCILKQIETIEKRKTEQYKMKTIIIKL